MRKPPSGERKIRTAMLPSALLISRTGASARTANALTATVNPIASLMDCFLTHHVRVTAFGDAHFIPQTVQHSHSRGHRRPSPHRSPECREAGGEKCEAHFSEVISFMFLRGLQQRHQRVKRSRQLASSLERMSRELISHTQPRTVGLRRNTVDSRVSVVDAAK